MYIYIWQCICLIICCLHDNLFMCVMLRALYEPWSGVEMRWGFLAAHPGIHFP